MENLAKYIKPSDGSVTKLEALDDAIMASSLDIPYDNALGFSITNAIDFINKSQRSGSGSPTFCMSSSGNGMNDNYLKAYIRNNKSSSLLYFDAATDDLVSVLCYNYDTNLKAMHIIAFCLNQKKNFGVKGYEIIDEVKELVRESIPTTGIKTIILESVGSALDFYKRQGFKRNLRRFEKGLIPMISHYAPRADVMGRERWSPKGPTPHVSSRSIAKGSSSVGKTLDASPATAEVSSHHTPPPPAAKLSSHTPPPAKLSSHTPPAKKSSHTPPPGAKKSAHNSPMRGNLLDDSDISDIKDSSDSQRTVVIIHIDPHDKKKDTYEFYDPLSHKRQKIDARPLKAYNKYGSDFITGLEYEKKMPSETRKKSHKRKNSGGSHKTHKRRRR
jgi:hypothetical protein